MEKKEILKAAKVIKVIGGDFKKLSLVIENGKFAHLDKLDKLVENDIITINPNQLFEVEISGDENTKMYVEAVATLSVSRQVKQYIMSAFLKGSIIDISCVHALSGEIDPESGRQYSSEEYSYRINNVVLPKLNPLVEKMILADIQNQTILEPKPSKPSISALFGAGSNAIVL